MIGVVSKYPAGKSVVIAGKPSPERILTAAIHVVGTTAGIGKPYVAPPPDLI